MSKKLKCEDVIRQIYDYLDKELDESTNDDIEHHLAHCRECFSRAEFERRLQKRVSETGESEVPERLRRRIKSMIDKF